MIVLLLQLNNPTGIKVIRSWNHFIVVVVVVVVVIIIMGRID